MVGQHPEAYGVPELNLFVADNLEQLIESMTGYRQIQLHGLLRTVAHLNSGEQTLLSLDMARRWMITRLKRNTAEVYQELCRNVAPLRIVDKSPVYSLDPKNLERIQLKPRDVVSFNKRDTRALKQPGAEPLVREVTLRAGDPEVYFKVTGVELKQLPEEVFSAQVEEVEPGKVYKVSVMLSGELDKRFTRGKLVITTDDPSLPTKELRLFAHFDVKRKTARK